MLWLPERLLKALDVLRNMQEEFRKEHGENAFTRFRIPTGVQMLEILKEGVMPAEYVVWFIQYSGMRNPERHSIEDQWARMLENMAHEFARQAEDCAKSKDGASRR